MGYLTEEETMWLGYKWASKLWCKYVQKDVKINNYNHFIYKPVRASQYTGETIRRYKIWMFSVKSTINYS